MIKLRKLIAPSFYEVHRAVRKHQYTHYWLKGGRGSAKSSFVSIELILGIMKHPDANAVAVRKVGLYLKDSVFEQLIWAIESLGVEELWKIKHSPLELIYQPTGQKILFRGADKPRKLKSTKVANGYIRYVWYEEADEFFGMDEIRSINQSLLRGGELFDVFYSYNPPQSQRNWVNTQTMEKREDTFVHHSTYLTVPQAWLGPQFAIEAEHLKKMNPQRYAHEYLGEVTGTGGEIFSNVTLRELSDSEIAVFDNIRRGIDFGYAVDPFVYIACHYDKTRRTLYIFDEICRTGLSNRAAAQWIQEKGENSAYIICDSAEPKSIRELRDYGLRVLGAKKGPDSVTYGIKFLQSLDAIIIDNGRCPRAAKEFLNYELEKDGQGGFRAEYPDKNNHTIDAVRYALEGETGGRRARVISREEWGF